MQSVVPDRGVGDDMLAIFGPGVRRTPDPLPVRTGPQERPGRSRGVIVATVVGLLIASAGAGAYFGTGLTDERTPAVASGGGARPPSKERAAPLPAIDPPAPTVVADRTVETLPPVVAEPPAQAVTRAAVVAEPQQSPTARRVEAVPSAAPDAPRPVLPDAPAPPDRSREIPVDPPVVSPTAAAERRAVDAFRTAAAAGVRPRILRDYQRELDRARGEASDQPRYAERLYGMIASDLLDLTEEAEERAGYITR